MLLEVLIHYHEDQKITQEFFSSTRAGVGYYCKQVHADSTLAGREQADAAGQMVMQLLNSANV